MNRDRIEKYGIVLRRLRPEDLEMLRHWRNHPTITQHMSYREYITREMQLSWYNRINNEQNHYFIIEWKSRDIGLINVKDIHEAEKCGEAGIFIWDDECQNSRVPFRATLAFGYYIFEILGFRSLYTHVLRSNKRSIRFNQFLGYKLQPGQDEVENQLYRRTREDYLKFRDRMSYLSE